MAKPFSTQKSQSRTEQGDGGSTTTGLQGSITPSNGGQTIIADETLTAFREGHSLGPARTVRQLRITVGNTTTVNQSDYGWGTRKIPPSVLLTDSNGLSGTADLTDAKATNFGKGDNTDEGTGSPAFGTVQTDSSVFGVALKKSFLVAHGLAELKQSILRATPAGLSALVEVYYPKTNRLARVPIVDVGPRETLKAAIDLTLALSAFLQEMDESDYCRLDNIAVSFRVLNSGSDKISSMKLLTRGKNSPKGARHKSKN